MNFIPHNIEIERIILGSLLKQNNLYDRVESIIDKEDFYDETHKKIYELIEDKISKGKIANILTLMGLFDDFGIDSDYVVKLTEDLISLENIIYYVEILRELSLRRKLISLGEDMKSSATKQSLNIDEQVNKIENTILNINKQQNTKKTIEFFLGASDLFKKTETMIKNKKNICGISSGFKDLDRTTGGFRKGELTILAARPSVGKTALAVNIGINVALQKIGVLFISLEMPYDQICSRMISSLSKVPLYNLMHGKMLMGELKECMKHIQKFSELPYFIHDSSFLDISSLRLIIKQMKRQHNIELVIVDYLQLMETIAKESREQEISKISRSLKLIAKDTDLPLLVLSQMSRDIEKRKEGDGPKLSDLRGSGSIEQDADLILFLYKDKESTDPIKLFVAKNRNGPLAEFNTEYVPEITTFENIIYITN